MSISQRESDKYETVWASISEYGTMSPGQIHAPMFARMIAGDQHFAQPSILDAGTGSGKGAFVLREMGFNVTAWDVTPEGLIPEVQTLLGDGPDQITFRVRSLWDGLGSDVLFNYVYCCDVFEHLPPQFTMLAATELLRVLKPGGKAFIALSNAPDQNGVWVGETLHLTVQSFAWWRDSFREIATVLEARDLIGISLFLLESKR